LSAHRNSRIDQGADQAVPAHRQDRQPKQSKKGTTSPSRLTLSDGTITHDACFEALDEYKFQVQMANMSIEHRTQFRWIPASTTSTIFTTGIDYGKIKHNGDT
jgi:hypothetical protein